MIMPIKEMNKKEVQNMCKNGKIVPLIYRNAERKMIGGILDIDEGVFLPVMSVNDERNMDIFLEMLEISAVSISEKLFVDKTKQLMQDLPA